MGTFAGYTGEMHLPEEKRALFAARMEKVLNYGGMMGIDVVKMHGCELCLLVPFRADPEKDVYFHYNYFEDDAWETAGFCAADGSLYSGKIGCSEFHDAIVAGYMLCELCDENPGMAEVNGDYVNDTYIVGWLNHLLGTQFSMQKRSRLWENAESAVLKDLRNGYDEGISYEKLMEIIPRGSHYYACSTELADLLYIIHGTASLDAGEPGPGTYPADILHCRDAVRDFLDADGEDAAKRLWSLVRSDRAERIRMAGEDSPADIRLSRIAAMSLYLPARVIVYLAAEHMELNFWKTWEQLRNEAYRDEQMKAYAPEWLAEKRRRIAAAPVKPVRTSDYLCQNGWFAFRDTPDELRGKPNYYLSDDDRLYWWSESSDEVILSEEIDRWLKELAGRHAAVMALLCGETGNSPEGKANASDFLKNFLTLLTEIEKYYKHIFPFQSMFYEFVENGGRAEYRAAVEVLRELAKENRKEGKIIERVRGDWELSSKNVTCNIARLRLKRYLSVMANPGLRKRYFGF